MPAQHHVRRGQAQAHHQKHHNDEARRLAERKSQGRPEERRGAGSRQNRRQHAVEKRARRAAFRGQGARRPQHPPAGVDLEQAKKVQRHQGHQHGQQHQKLRIAELHSPARFMPRRLDPDHQSGQHEKRHQHPQRVD